MSNKPIVKLVNWTPEPLLTMALACKMYDGECNESLDDLRKVLPTIPVQRAYLQRFFDGPHKTFMEYVQTEWTFQNVSRAFQQQLTRHRLATYAIESLRVKEVGHFAGEGSYTMPSTVRDKARYHENMLKVQLMYSDMIENGESIEDARGILPLNIHSSISMRTDLKSLMHLTAHRLCSYTQEEFRIVAWEMKKEVGEKLGKEIGALLQPPCVHGKCIALKPCKTGPKVLGGGAHVD